MTSRPPAASHGSALSDQVVGLRRLAPAHSAPIGPRLNGADARPGSRLPVPLTELIGREADIDGCLELLGRGRLVSLTGPGGVGKTRLALAAGARAAPGFTGGVCWVGLAPVQTPPGVATAIAEALGIAGTSREDAAAVVRRHLHDESLLLVLDNCEQVRGACAQLCADLLEACPGVTVLTTSRERLGIPGELTWPVPPLTLPEWAPDNRLDPAASGAVSLFVARCRELVPQFRLGPDNTDSAVRVCRRLDGLPLAIELAAAQVRVLGAVQLADALDTSPHLLADRTRPGAPRHRTLQATLDWSHELLYPAEQLMFRGISIFPGPFDLTAATAVARSLGIEAGDVVDLLGRLVDTSLVQVVRAAGQARYRLLSTVRDYGRDRLRASGEFDAVARAHLAHFTAVAEPAVPLLFGAGGPAELDRLEREGDNFRAALDYARTAGEHELGVRLAAALWPLCYLRGLYREGRQWLDWAVGVGDAAPEQVRANALRGSGTLAFLQCDYDVAAPRLERALETYRTLGDDRGVAEVLMTLGGIARERGRYDAARQRYTESRALSQGLGDRRGVARADNYLGFVACLEGDLDAADETCAATLEVFRGLGDAEGVAWSLLSRGVVAQYRGALDRAQTLLQECRRLSVEAGYREGIAWSEHELGIVALRRGDPAGALTRLRAAFAEHRELGDRWRTAAVLEDLAAAQVAGAPHRAASLLGAAGRLRDDIGAPLAPVDRAGRAATLARLEAALGAELAGCLAAGRDRRAEDLLTAAEPPVGTVQLEQPPPTPESGAWLEIHALGRSGVRVAGRDLTATDWSYAKPRELLYLLADGRPRSKEQVGVALWPDASAQQLRNAMHTALRELRRVIDRPGWVVYAEGRYRFTPDPGACWYDVRAFLDELRAVAAATGPGRREPLRRAAALYTGEFLPDGPETDWIIERRGELAGRNRAVLHNLGRSLATDRMLDEAVATYQRLVRLDPLDEEAHRGLMACWGRGGDRARVVRHYRELAGRLHAELGVAPAAATTALYRRFAGS